MTELVVDRDEIRDFSTYLNNKISDFDLIISNIEKIIEPINQGTVWNDKDAKGFKDNLTKHIKDLKEVEMTLSNCQKEIRKNSLRYDGALSDYSNRK